MRCKKAEDLMMRYIDAPLAMNRWKTKRFFGHLRACDGCREEFTVYEDMIHGFADFPEAEAPEGFEAAVAARVAERRRVAPGQVMMLAWGALSVLLGVCVLVLLNGDAAGVSAMLAVAERQYNVLLAALGEMVETYRYIFAAALALGVAVWSRVATRGRAAGSRRP